MLSCEPSEAPAQSDVLLHRSSDVTQSDLWVGPADDPVERDADRIAEEVLRIDESELAIAALPALSTRKSPLRNAAAEASPSRAGSTVVDAESTQAPAAVYEVLRRPGRPLASAVRAFFEPRFGHDFGYVRVHADSEAAQSARAVNAVAYTVGQHIVFGEGTYRPETRAGRKTLAHELSHTLQHSMAENPATKVHPAQLEHDRDVSARPLQPHNSQSVLRQTAHTGKLDADEGPNIADITHDFEPMPHLIQLNAPAAPEVCEQMPGGKTHCEKDETGTSTGRVVQDAIVETSPCIRPCVEQHEAAHAAQLKKQCPQDRDCYRAVDRGQGNVGQCYMKAIRLIHPNECAAYNVSVPCIEKRLKNAKECQSPADKEYGTRKLKSERCFQDMYCAAPSR